MDKLWTKSGQTLDKVWTLCPDFVQSTILLEHRLAEEGELGRKPEWR